MDWVRLVTTEYCMYVVVINRLASTPPSALCGNVGPTRLGGSTRLGEVSLGHC